MTSDHQFGFKPNSSTVLCTTMLVETVQYYEENGRQPVYVLQLDASKAFDRVSYSRLFNVLLDNNVCPYIVRLLCYMYLNQSLYSLRCMNATCEEFANEYQIDFNPTKSKLICFNANIDHTPHIVLNGRPVSVVT